MSHEWLIAFFERQRDLCAQIQKQYESGKLIHGPAGSTTGNRIAELVAQQTQYEEAITRLRYPPLVTPHPLVGWYFHLYDSGGGLRTIGQVSDVSGTTITAQAFSLEGVSLGTVAFGYADGIRWRLFRDPTEWLYAAQLHK